MRSARVSTLVVAVLLFAFVAGTAPAAGQTVPGAILTGIRAARAYFAIVDYAHKLPGIFSNYNKCLARVDLQAHIDSFSGNTLSMMFEIEGWPTAGQGYALGISRALPVPLNTAVRFGTVAGWNMNATPLPGVTIRPSRFGQGYLIGFQGNYFTLDRLRVGVYSTQDNLLRYQYVAVTPQMVRLYPAGSTTPVLLTQPTYTPEGRLKIPVEMGGVRYSRVDLIFPGSVYTQGVQGPVTTPGWTGPRTWSST